MKPNKKEESLLLFTAGARRYVYNWALARRKEYYTEYGKTLPYNQLSSELTQLKKQPETQWLNQAISQALIQSLRDLERTFRSFFRKQSRYPTFRTKKKGGYTFRVPQNVIVANSKVYVPKIGWIRICQSQEIEGKTKSATFKRDNLGHWYVSVVVEFEMPDVEPPSPSNPVGVDLGLRDFITLSDGKVIGDPKYLRSNEKRLKKLHRGYSRKKRGSGRKEKARVKLAKAHKKVANQRLDFLHKLTRELVDTYDCICMESLSVNALAKTKLSYSLLDASFGEFVRQIGYKSTWNIQHSVKVDRFFPSTKMCSECGVVNNDLTLKDREWTCSCGVTHDRDLNAAINILREGMRILSEKQLAVGHTDSLNAHGEDVRPSTGGEPRGSENPEVGESQYSYFGQGV